MLPWSALLLFTGWQSPPIVAHRVAVNAGEGRPQRAGGLRSPAAACPTTQCVYVANGTAGAGVTVYPSTATGNASPYRTIAGKRSGLTNAAGIAVDAKGVVYVSAVPPTGRPFVSEFAATANGNVAPLSTIVGPATRLKLPNSIAVDAGGNIYAGNNRGACLFGRCLYAGFITEYAAGSNGNVTPGRVILGKKTEMIGVAHIAVDSAANIYFPPYQECDGTYCVGENGVLAFGPDAHGNSPPSWAIVGSNTGLSGDLGGLAVDNEGNVYVVNIGTPETVFVYAAGARGNAAPIQAISGSRTGLLAPVAVAVDASHNIYVTNYANDSVTVYAEGATGNVAPIRIIKGRNTGIARPNGIAIH